MPCAPYRHFKEKRQCWQELWKCQRAPFTDISVNIHRKMRRQNPCCVLCVRVRLSEDSMPLLPRADPPAVPNVLTTQGAPRRQCSGLHGIGSASTRSHLHPVYVLAVFWSIMGPRLRIMKLFSPPFTQRLLWLVAQPSVAFLATVHDSKADMRQTCTWWQLGQRVTSLVTPLFCSGHGSTQTSADTSHLFKYFTMLAPDKCPPQSFSSCFVSRWRLICVLIGAGEGWGV